MRRSRRNGNGAAFSVRMGKADSGGPKGRSRGGDPAAVFAVAEQRKPPGSELHADLVSAAGMKAHTDQRNRLSVIIRPVKNLPGTGSILNACAFAGDDEGFVLRPVVPEQVRIHACLFSRTAADCGQICFFF